MKSQIVIRKIDLDLIMSWMRREYERMGNVISTIERNQNFHDEYVIESLKITEMAVRQIKKFINET